MPTIREAPRQVPVCHEADLCVLGGSCTGLFAALRAARCGLSVALVERAGVFGGVATQGLVNIWHSLYDTRGETEIIAGLTREVIERLRRRAAVTLHDPADGDRYAVFNSAELVLELDELVRAQPRVRPFLHSRFAAPVVDEAGRMTHALLEDKSGRRAVAARVFLDATGDGDCIARLGYACRRPPCPQPPTVCAILHGLAAVEAANPGFDLGAAVCDPQFPEALPPGFLWTSRIPGLPDARLVAGTRAAGADAADADELTAAELDCRRQVRAICDLLRRRIPGGEGVALGAVSPAIGIRETRHAVCRHTLTEAEVLGGADFPDTIAQGSYRVDVHHADRPGLTFRYLDGREVHCAPGRPPRESRWRGPVAEEPTFYRIPYRCLVPRESRNVLVAGRLLDADPGAYGAVRVMVTCNQTGEAAGVAAALALEHDCDVGAVPVDRLQARLQAFGGIIRSAAAPSVSTAGGNS
jgi:hypothetical protein